MLSWASTMLAFNARPPDPAVVGRALARAVARAPRADAALRRGVALAPAPRRVLEAGLGLRGLRRDRLPGLHGRRLGRRLPRTRSCASSPGYAGPAQGPDRPVGAPLPATTGVPGPAIGFLQECAALVGPLAQGRRHRDHGRADAPRLDAGRGRRRAALRGAAGPLGRRAGLALAEPRDAPARAHARRARAASPATPRARAPRPAGARARARHLGRVRLARRLRPRPAGRGRPLALLHVAPLDERLELLGFPEVALDARHRPAVRAGGVRLCDVAPGRRRRRWSRAACSTSPTARATSSPTPLVPGEPLRRSRLRLKAIAYAFPPGHRIRLALSPTLLAVGLAVARAGHADRRHGRRVRASAPGPAAAPRRTACSLRSRSPRGRRRSPSRSPSPAGPRGRFATTSPPVVGSSPPTSSTSARSGSPETGSSSRNGDGTPSRSSRETRSRRRRARTGRSRSVAATGARGSRPRAG